LFALDAPDEEPPDFERPAADEPDRELDDFFLAVCGIAINF
jgi:hypothetical protein